jgi:hypothetical protein
MTIISLTFGRAATDGVDNIRHVNKVPAAPITKAHEYTNGSRAKPVASEVENLTSLREDVLNGH